MNNRNQQAADALAEALHRLAAVSTPDDSTGITLRLGPDDGSQHHINLPANTVEALTDAIDSLHAYLASGEPDPETDARMRAAIQATEDAVTVDHTGLDRAKARLMAWMEGQSGEAIATGEWSAAAVAQCDTDLWDQVNDVYAALDVRTISGQVMDDRIASPMQVIEALDDVYGDNVTDPYADEDTEGGE